VQKEAPEGKREGALFEAVTLAVGKDPAAQPLVLAGLAQDVNRCKKKNKAHSRPKQMAEKGYRAAADDGPSLHGI
jgi:hypothetical protein